MKFLEKDLEDIIWESDNVKLQEKGLDIQGKKYRQLRIGKYGIADIVTIEKDYSPSKYVKDEFKTLSRLIITVYELKKEKAGISAFLQAVRYVKGISQYIESFRGKDIEIQYNIVLCAKEIDKTSDYIYLTDLLWANESYGCLSTVKNYSFDYDLEGIKFSSESNYQLIENGFKK